VATAGNISRMRARCRDTQVRRRLSSSQRTSITCKGATTERGDGRSDPSRTR
jgi:hypothetical protein